MVNNTVLFSLCTYKENLFSSHSLRIFAIYDPINFCTFPGSIHGHSAAHAPLKTIQLPEWVIIAENVDDLFYIWKASIYDEVQVWEGLSKLKDPGVLERGNGAVLLRIQTFKVGLARVDYKFSCTALFAHYSYEILNVLPLIQVIHTKSALHRHWYCNLLSHLSNNFSDVLGVFHQNGTERSLYNFVRWASAIDVNLIIPELLTNLGGLPHSHRVTPT